MPQKLTKNQKDYRKRKKEANSASGLTTTIGKDGIKNKRVSRKPLCIRINQEAAAILYEAAKREGIAKWKLLDRMIKLGIPGSLNENSGGNTRLPILISEETQKIRYKGSKGSVQINYRITVTAWEKLERHSKVKLGQSKAKAVQELILNYKFITDAARERNQRYQAKDRRIKESYGYRKIQNSEDQENIRRKPWEKSNGEIKLRPGLTLDHLSEEELEEYTELVSKNTERLKKNFAERFDQNQQDTVNQFDQAELKEIANRYMQLKGIAE